MGTPFFRFINPLVKRALEDDDERREQIRMQNAKPSVVVSPEFGGKVSTTEAPVFSPSGMFSAPVNKQAAIPPPTVAPSSAARVAQLVGSFADRSGLASAQEDQYQTAEQLAMLQEGADPLPENLHGMRDQVTSQMQANAQRPVKATYEPHEEGFKGDLRHIGESFLMTLANAPKNARGEIDPLATGIAASMGALFGGGGTHQRIAEQYKQPQLDAENAMHRKRADETAKDLNTLAKLNPNNAENKIAATQTRLKVGDARVADAKDQYGTNLEVGYSEYKRGQEAEENRKSEAAALQRAEIGFKAAQMRDQQNFTQQIQRDKLNFNQSMSQRGIDDYQRSVSEIQKHKNDLAKAESVASALEEQLRKHDAEEINLGRNEVGKIRTEAMKARAEANALRNSIKNLAQAEAQKLNTSYRGTKPFVNYDPNTDSLTINPDYAPPTVDDVDDLRRRQNKYR